MLAVKRLQQIRRQHALLFQKSKTTPLFWGRTNFTTKMADTTTRSAKERKEGPQNKCASILTKHLPEGMDPRQVVRDFMTVVNMSGQEIEGFLATEESRKAAELTDNAEEHQGRHLGRRICELLGKVGEHKNDPHAYELSLLYEADFQQMYQVTDYIRCQLEKQEKERDPLWRFRLMNCGYDPLKEEKKVAERQEK
jgi:hypothetical protein